MLIFHEGLPRSGKSYEAVVKHLIPALSKGRKVYTNIAGLNLPQIADLAGISEADASSLVRVLADSEVPKVYDVVSDNSLVLLDELQNFFPQKQKPLEPKITDFVAQHGHRGLDIVAMGQDHRDCHALFKRRIDRLIVFIKKDMLGKPHEYHWTLKKQLPGGRFGVVNSGSSSYDPKYFGCYKSFDDGVRDDEAQDDKRGSLFSSWQFRWGLPLAAVVILICAGYLVYMFFGGGFVSMVGGNDGDKKIPKSTPVQPVPAVQGPGLVPVSAAPSPALKVEPVKFDETEIDKHNAKWRPRLSGVIQQGARMQVVIEWYDDSLRVKDRLDLAGLQGYGYAVVVDAGGATVSGPHRKPFRVTAWPMEAYAGTASRPMLNAISAGSRAEPAPVVVYQPAEQSPVRSDSKKPFTHIRD